MMSMIEKIALFELAAVTWTRTEQITHVVSESLDSRMRDAKVSYFRDLHEYIENVNENEDESVTLELEDRLGDFLNYRATKMIDDAREAD